VATVPWWRRLLRRVLPRHRCRVPGSDHRCPGSRGMPARQADQGQPGEGVRWAKDYVLGDKVKVADAAG